MSDEQDRAGSLDDDVIADDEDPIPENDDDRFEEIAGIDEEFPPDVPLGVEDPGRFEIEDDLATREARGAQGDDR